MWSMIPKVLLQIKQLAVGLSSTGSLAKGINLFELVVFVAGDFRLSFFQVLLKGKYG